jgi:hypothetical protein
VQPGREEVAGLENARSGEHSSGMVDKFRARLLEVEITPEPPFWHWRVFAGNKILCSGSEDDKIKASFEGNNAMFEILAKGWDHNPSAT